MNESTKTYLVATFESFDSESNVIEGGLNFEQANFLAQDLLKTNYGVEIIDEDDDNMEPIVLVLTKVN